MIYLWLALNFFSCSEESLNKIDGTTLRIGTPKSSDDSDIVLKLLTKENECEQTLRNTVSLIPKCLPWVNRGAGEVRLSFTFMSGYDPFRLPVERKHLSVSHNGRLVKEDDKNDVFVELIPHDPVHVKQLFILMIDTSGSMSIQDSYADKNRMEIVKTALTQNNVKAAFFPEDVKTAVLLYEFTDGVPRPVGGQLQFLEDRETYSSLISSIQPRGGYTHLYNSIKFAAVDLLKREEVREWMEVNEAQPTIIALTDGFNNEKSDDVCSDNSSRLQNLVETIRRVRGDPEVDIRYRPLIYTVGLGTPILPRFKLPRENRAEVSGGRLCNRNREVRIDGNLENKGIDNASLAWIADVGEGSSFVKRSARGLGEAFTLAAAKRYLWYELRYKIHPSNLDRQFVTRLRLNTFADASAEVTLYPNAWMDLPPGKGMKDSNWSEKQSIFHSLSVLIPILSLLIFFPMLSPMLINVRRILSGRRRRPPKPSQQS
ncbi:MAG: vWA domain-containing protein [Myxococcota bacterium]|nr:vWA domain-containing protein [Myxococcota bacterium]MEC8382311.1 vWA domain-containing protein [Myxococcota bacterium]